MLFPRIRRQDETSDIGGGGGSDVAGSVAGSATGLGLLSVQVSVTRISLAFSLALLLSFFSILFSLSLPPPTPSPAHSRSNRPLPPQRGRESTFSVNSASVYSGGAATSSRTETASTISSSGMSRPPLPWLQVEVWLTIAGLFQDLHQYKDAQLAIAMARGLDGYNADVECAHGVLHEAQGESAEGEWLWLVR